MTKPDYEEAAQQAAKKAIEMSDKYNLRINQLEAENKELRNAIKWVINDMSYKAPEQAFGAIYDRWIPTLQQPLKENSK